MLAASFVSPRYFATIVCDPPCSEDVTNMALPLDSVPVPSVVGGLVLVSLNCTVPVADDGDTVAVNVTDWPNVEGFGDEESVVVVDIWLTVCVNGAEVLPALFVSPEYVAMMLCVPAVKEDIVKVATPPDSVTGGWGTPSILNVTVPVADDGDTVALNITDWPNVEGFGDDEMDIVAVASFIVW
jgi:hypothetical protein